MQGEVLRRLREIVGPANVLTGQAIEEVYSYDASLGSGKPCAVVLPASTPEVAAAVRLVTRERIPYTPRGFGTNLSGGSVAAEGGVIICLTRMNRIVSIRPERRCATVECGLTNLELQNTLAPLGFLYAPDPASQKVSTMGGNLAENAGGPHCVKYGVTSNHILGIEAVLPGGEVVNFGGPALDPPGFDIRGVLIGSEGTFAVATRITVRILPVTEKIATLLVIYDDASDAARSVSDIVAAGIIPATLEMMDAPVMRAVEESFPCGYPLDAAAVLIAEVDGPAEGMRDQVERIKEICRRNNCRTVREARDSAERDLLWSGRRGAFGAVARLAPNYLVADCSVPRTRLPEALAHVASVAQRYDLRHANVFHAGDGNLHPLLFFDSRDRDQVHRVHEAGWEIMKGCVDLGGTITGEHGVGSEKAKAMRMVYSEDDLEFQYTLRRAFDPDGLLNPKKIFPGEPRVESAGLPPAATASMPDQFMPADPGEAVEMVREALSLHVALLPVGGGNERDYGNLLNRPAVPLCSSRLRGVIEYDAPNQVVTVGAGMALRELQQQLGTHRQWLPVVPPKGLCATVGSVVALGSCGADRLRHGAPRDMILGLRFVSGRGRLIRAGGKVVKNVAGYDVTRLIAGSAGTLGFLTEITFKVAPLPELGAAVRGVGTVEACGAAASKLLCSKLEPVSIVSEQRGESSWRLTAGFEGFVPTVRWQTTQAAQLMQAAGIGEVETAEYDCRQGTASSLGSVLDNAHVVRIDVPLDRALQFVQALQGTLKPARLFADLGCGRIRAGYETMDEDAWARLCGLACAHEGHAILDKAPVRLKERIDVFGPPRPDWRMIHAVKDRLDPENVFSPGRLPGRK